MFPIAAILFIGAIVWGYQEHQEKNSILIKAENQYQRAFHDLAFHMDHLHQQLGGALAVNSASQGYQRKSLINVWRLTSQAQGEINQLPLMLLPFNKTEEFLSKIANFAYRISTRDLSKEPMTADEVKTLSALYDRSDDISKQLQDVRSKVLQNHLRWMDVELALAAEQRSEDNSIIDGFKTVNDGVSAYSEMNWGPVLSADSEEKSYRILSGSPATAREIKRKAAQFLGVKDLSRLTVKEQGKGTDYDTFHVVMDRQDGKGQVDMDYTRRGGQLVWFMDSRAVDGESIGVDQAIASAQSFLQRHQYDDMKAVNYDLYDHAVSLAFAAVKDGVVLYPEQLAVKVALDNGDVVGLQAENYLFEHGKKRELKKTGLRLEEAAKSLNPKFVTERSQLALVKNEWKQEVLCYEFVGRINGTDYRICINADNGQEEMIEPLNTPNDQKI